MTASLFARSRASSAERSSSAAFSSVSVTPSHLASLAISALKVPGCSPMRVSRLQVPLAGDQFSLSVLKALGRTQNGRRTEVTAKPAANGVDSGMPAHQNTQRPLANLRVTYITGNGRELSKLDVHPAKLRLRNKLKFGSYLPTVNGLGFPPPFRTTRATWRRERSRQSSDSLQSASQFLQNLRGRFERCEYPLSGQCSSPPSWIPDANKKWGSHVSFSRWLPRLCPTLSAAVP
jgi:hypothetical protein